MSSPHPNARNTENPGRSRSPHQGPGQLTKSETSTEVRSLEPFPGRRQARGEAAYLPPGPGRAWGSPVALRRLRQSSAELGTVGKPPAGRATAEGKKAWVRRQNAAQYLPKPLPPPAGTGPWEGREDSDAATGSSEVWNDLEPGITSNCFFSNYRGGQFCGSTNIVIFE